MAIIKSFNNNDISEPGSYSKFKVDNSSGSALGANTTILLVGESSKGAPGSSTGITEFSAARLDALIETYGNGPIVDCAVAASRPSKTPNIGGAGRFLVYKTNPSTQATATLTQSASDQFDVLGRAYGTADNNYSVVVADGTTASQKLITITELNGTTESLGENAANDILTVTYTGNASTSTLTIAGATRGAQLLTTTLAGDQTDGSANLNITLANYTLSEVATLINDSVGYTCTLDTATEAAKPGTDLDPVSALDISTAKTLLKLQIEILDLLNTSGRVEATEEATILGGVPDNQTQALGGGVQGASTNTTFSTGFNVSLANDYSVLLPCISRDASDDIADAIQGFTDPASTYTISSVLNAASSHLTVRGSTKNRKEAQGFGGHRSATKATSFSVISALNTENMQVAMQDALFVNSAGTITVGHPHVHAAMMAGIRLGSEVGEPLTHKFLNSTGVGHVIDPVTLLETGDYNEGTDAEDAILNGVTISEKEGSGYRIVVDNTSYGQDDSFIFNRGSVVEAAYFTFQTLRKTAESAFVGGKLSSGAASSIKNLVRNRLRELNAPDVNIITGSDDAPEGFKEDTFVVTVTGNTARVQVEFKPVQGLDFIFFDFTVGDITQTA